MVRKVGKFWDPAGKLNRIIRNCFLKFLLVNEIFEISVEIYRIFVFTTPPLLLDEHVPRVGPAHFYLEEKNLIIL